MIQNMRDLGGIRTQDGYLIRKGMMVRSANLCQAEDPDLEGISAVIDLRTPGERKESPDRVCGRQYLPDMAYLYGRRMRECTGSFQTRLRTIMRHDFSTGAVLWHCTEGKDRCGMTTALVLEVLGVDREIIREDYLKTNIVNIPKATRARDQLMESHGKEFAESMYQAYIADERYLRAAWDAMGTDYIREKLHISNAEIESFRQNVLWSP